MISIHNLHFSYDKKKKLFDGMDLQIEPGKIYGLLGKNGTGKSSLLKLLSGVIFPKLGSIRLNEYNPVDRKPAMLEDIFFLSEDYQLPDISASLYLSIYSVFYKSFDEAKFYSITEIFEVPLGQGLDQLSFGQKKKFLIAFGLATNAKYILLDEPTNGLDIPSKSQFRKVMASSFSEHQVVIISTHQIRDLSQLIESVIIIDDGKIIFRNDLIDVENKLMFVRSLSNERIQNSIYSEMVTGGYVHILPNPEQEVTDVELEILFNAFMENRDLINSHF